MLNDTERLAFLAKVAQHMSLYITYSEDADSDEPLGYTIEFGTCSPVVATAGSLEAAIDLAYLEAESGIDG